MSFFGQGNGNSIYNHRLFSMEDGMASRSVLCGTQDNQGFLWFGTRDGLNRFDGKNFRLFTKKNNGLFDNKIAQIVCDGHDHLILIYGTTISDEDGQNMEILDLKSFKILPFKRVFPHAPFPSSSIDWIEMEEGNINFYQGNINICWRLTNGYFYGVKTIPDRASLDIKREAVWTTLTQKYKIVQEEVAFSKSSFEPLASQNTDEFSFYNTRIGLNLYSNGQVLQLIDSTGWVNYSNIESVLAFFKDVLGNYWFCTPQGVIKVAPKKDYFTKYFTKSQTNVHYNTNQTRGIYADEHGRVFANVWHFFCSSDGEIYSTSFWGAPLLFHHGKYYGGSDKLFEFDLDTRTFTLLPFPFKCQSWSIFPISRWKTLIGTSIGIIKYDLQTHESNDSIPRPAGVPKPMISLRFIQSRDGTIWAACANGLYQFDKNGETVIAYFGPSSASPKPFSNLYDIHEDKKGIFWMATTGEGLYRWDRKTDEIKQFTNTEGLPSNILYRIEEDEFENLWISTDNGLTKFNTQEFTTKTYTVKDGLSHNEFNRIASFKAPDGRMFFGGVDGVNAFYPKDLVNDNSQSNAPLQVISFEMFNQSDVKQDINIFELHRDKTIIMKSGDRFFNMEFRLLNFEEGTSRYSYKIDGYDHQWNHLNTNSLRVNKLPYGTFVLNIKAQNPNGTWSNNTLQFSITVLKPFYLQWWFLMLCAGGVVTLLVLYMRQRTNKLVKDRQKLEQAVEQRTEQLSQMLVQKNLMMKEIHHRVKNNLQVISGLLELQQHRTKDAQIQEALLDSQNRVLSISFIHQNLYQHDELKGVEIHTFTTELCNHIHRLFSKESCPVTIKSNIEHLFLDLDTALPLGLIINELLTNSYKYAFDGMTQGEISIVLKKTSEGHYAFHYHDNGKGLPPGLDLKKVQSLGLRLITRLSKQLGGEIIYTQQNGSNFALEFKDFTERNKTT